MEYYFSDLNLATTDHLMRFINKDPEGFGKLFSFEFLYVCARVRFSICGHCNIFNLMLTLQGKGQDSLL